MNPTRFDRQSFLGARSADILGDCRVAINGLGGGGSHIVQQLAHIGIGKFVVVDPDCVEETNLNRLVGAVASDVDKRTPKVDVAARMILGVNPGAHVTRVKAKWQEMPNVLRDCDFVFGCLDGFAERNELERFSRRFLLPYVDIGMDVHAFNSQFIISGQVALSMPDGPCLWCMGLLSEKLLVEEVRRYGAAGHHPQVIWPNGILASTAVGVFVQCLTPWCAPQSTPILLEYDGNAQTIMPSNKLTVLATTACQHHRSEDRGDPFFAR